jgi:DNA mismatch repair protein MutL
MSLIHVLPPDVAAKIAAGEVVERPASVVKELVDNAIDAAAERIVVEIQDGGRKLIRVTDNGQGMPREDVQLAVERHATSKIETAEDLDAIATFGFRGEALASIAAVTRFEIITRQPEDMEGTRLSMEGTQEPAIEPVGCPAGTTVSARDIYFNTPARRKFLKTTATELSHVADMVNRAALPHHQVHFILRHNDKTVLDYPRVETRQERLYAFTGRSGWEKMRALPQTGGEDVSVEGYVSIPTETRNRADQVFFFVNDRYVQNRMLLSSVMDAYRRLVHPGRYPVAMLFIYVNPDSIDINVHPKKQEIKFSDEQRIWRTVHSGVRSALTQMEQNTLRMSAPPAPADDGVRASLFKSQSGSKDYGAKPTARTDDVRQAVDRFFKRRAEEEKQDENLPQDEGETKAPPPTEQPPKIRQLRTVISSETEEDAEAREEVEATEAPEESHPPVSPPEKQPEPDTTGPMFESSNVPALIGQVLDTYILCEQQGRLLIVDQHAAAERIRYDRLSREMDQGPPKQQTLLFPLMIEMPAGDVKVLQENLELMRSFGFDLEFFGQNTFSLSSAPAMVAEEDCERLVRDLLKDIGGKGAGVSLDQMKEAARIKIACHTSLRAGTRLEPKAMMDLLEQLFRTNHPFTCPHGRPTIVAWEKGQLERFFKRSGF